MKDRFKQLFVGSNVFLLISGCALLCIPLCDVNAIGRDRWLSYIVAAIFWLGLILTHVCNIVCGAIYKRSGYNDKKTKNGRYLLFMRNKLVLIIDVMLLISVSMLLAIILVKVKDEWLIIVTLCFVYMTVNMHTIFNSRAGDCIVNMMKGSRKNDKQN